MIHGVLFSDLIFFLRHSRIPKKVGEKIVRFKGLRSGLTSDWNGSFKSPTVDEMCCRLSVNEPFSFLDGKIAIVWLLI